MRWLGRPWFFAAVAVLALNDHVFKAAFPGPLTGKLSDVAGVAVVGTLASVALGRSWGTILTGAGFAALKTVPGVAEAVAPLLGGGVTLRDATDLVALIVLPVLWTVLGRTSDSARSRRGWAVFGLVAGVLATTATSAPPPTGIVDVAFVDGAFYARIHFEHGGSRWIRSGDGGATWEHAEDPGDFPPAASPDALSRQACANDGVCYRVEWASDGQGPRRTRAYFKRREAGSLLWVTEATTEWSPDYRTLYWDTGALAINPSDSSQAVGKIQDRAFARIGTGIWDEKDLIASARIPPDDRFLAVALGDTMVCLTLLGGLGVLIWTLTLWRPLQIGATVAVAGVAGITFMNVVLAPPVPFLYDVSVGALIAGAVFFGLHLLRKEELRRRGRFGAAGMTQRSDWPGYPPDPSEPWDR